MHRSPELAGHPAAVERDESSDLGVARLIARRLVTLTCGGIRPGGRGARGDGPRGFVDTRAEQRLEMDDLVVGRLDRAETLVDGHEGCRRCRARSGRSTGHDRQATGKFLEVANLWLDEAQESAPHASTHVARGDELIVEHDGFLDDVPGELGHLAIRRDAMSICRGARLDGPYDTQYPAVEPSGLPWRQGPGRRGQ